MTNSTFQHPHTEQWRALYRAALLETNPLTACQKIADAEAAVVARTRELFHETGQEAEVERDALDDALYALRALRNAAEHADSAA